MKKYLLLLLFFVLLVACGADGLIPPIQDSSELVTLTPLPTNTPHPTEIPTSDDATGKIADVSTAEQTIKLSDGKVYVAPAEFNFEGLDKNVEVVIFYTVVDGKRMINDLEVVQ